MNQHPVEDAARRAFGCEPDPLDLIESRAARVAWLLPRFILLAGFVGLWAILR